MARVVREICGAADAGIGGTAVSGSTRPQGRCFLRPGLAGAIDADRRALPGAAWANGVHGVGGTRPRRRSGGLRPLPRGLCLAAGEAIEAGGTPPAPIDPAS